MPATPVHRRLRSKPECWNISRVDYNAGYHKPRKITRFIESCHNDIMPLYLPPYTPELNPTEGQWKMMRTVTTSRLYGTTKAMKDSIWAMLGSGELGFAKMGSCLS